MSLFSEELRRHPQLGLAYTYPAPGVIERIGPDWDWIWIDGQHGELDYRDILAAVRACNYVKRPAIVRVPGHAYGTIGRMLDISADGIMVPMVETPEQARQVIAAAKFPPTGNRSFGGRRVVDLHGRTFSGGYNNPLLIVQIETPGSVENMERIAEMDGIDGLFVGLDDMAIREGCDMGAKMDLNRYDALLERMARIAAKRNRVAGGVFTDPARLTKACQMGFTLMGAASDVGLLASGSTGLSSQFRALVTEREGIRTIGKK